jgi:Domain of unknown function (DUF7024)
MKAVWSLALLAILSGLYGVVAYMVCWPKVSPEYRAYYINRNSIEWKNGPRYAARPEQGISFGTEGLPTFVKYLYGFEQRQPWGRWTDGNLGTKAGIVLNQGLSGSVCLEMRVKPANSQLSKEITVTFGHRVRKLVLNDPDFGNYFIDFVESNSTDTVEFRFQDLPPQIADGRRIGLGMEYLRLFPENCTTVQKQLSAEVPGDPGRRVH